MIETIPVGFMAVPASAVVFYPEWYFMAYNAGLGLLCFAIGIVAGIRMQKKRSQ